MPHPIFRMIQLVWQQKWGNSHHIYDAKYASVGSGTRGKLNNSAISGSGLEPTWFVPWN